jgi:hypothetical protein
MMTLEQLRDLVERLPDGAALLLSKASLFEALSVVPTSPAAPPADLTVAELAAWFHRSPSTVRGWLGADRFPGAYKLNRRDWRVPKTALASFLEVARNGGRPSGAADLGAWRRHRRR